MISNRPLVTKRISIQSHALLEESESSYHIYPLSFQTSPVEEKIICEQTSSSIKGVKIKFPNGTELSIDDVMAKDLAALLLSCNTGY